MAARPDKAALGPSAAASTAAPVAAEEFQSLMAAVGPFEDAPRVAVAVSGGPDSMALALMLRDWADRRGGEIVALTVDHGLRPDSAAEAGEVAGWLAARAVRHHILRWRAPRPGHGLQAAARGARYGLLGAWCRRHGVLHLAVAHQMEDQAETLLLRLARGSGLDGLAAMAAIGEVAGVRLIRPLLPVARRRLQATLTACGQPWIEDPSNRDPAYMRTRLRLLLPVLAPAGLTPERLAGTARRLARARAAIDDAVADLLARAVALYPAGYARIAPAAFATAPGEVSLRALARCLLAVGGGAYPPRLERLERLHAALIEAGVEAGPAPPRTLAGCRILWHRGAVILCRETAQAVQELAVAPGARLHWDGRFAVSVGRAVRRPGLRLRRLGADGWRQVAAAAPALRASAVPPAVRPTLPALWRGRRVVAVPHLDYWTGEAAAWGAALRVEHAPAHALTNARFTVA